MKKYKDESNKRIEAEVRKLAEFMDKEGRGFIFATVPQMSKHRSFLAYTCPDGENIVAPFWACVLSIVCNMKDNVPKELQPEFKKGFKAFMRASMEQFNMKMVEL